MILASPKKKIDELCTLINGHGFTPPEWSDSGYPIIRIQNLNGSRDFNYYSQEPKEQWIVETGDLLFAWAGVKGVSFGPTIWNGPRGVLNQHIYRIIPNKEVNKLWLYFALVIITSSIEAKAHGFKSSLLHVRKSDITGQVIPLPDITEQCKIAEILGAWDEAIDLLTQTIVAKRKLKKGLMQQLLTGDRRFKEFEGSEWKKYKLGYLVKKIGSGITPKGGRNVYLDDGIPLIRSQNVLWGRLSLKDVAYISLEQHNKMRSTQLELNDVLLNITGASIGRSCVFNEMGTMANVNQHVCIIRTTEDLDPFFLSGYLNSHFGQAQILSFQAGGNREGLNFEQIRSFNIILPSVAEQEKIAAVLSAADDEITTLEKQLTAVKQQKRGLMQQLLTGKKRVKV